MSDTDTINLSILTAATPPRAGLIRLPKALMVGLLLATISPLNVMAQEDDAMAEFRLMTDYLASVSSFSVNYDSSLEIVTTDLQKIEFTSSGSAAVVRPNQFHIERVGGFTDVELVSDGTTLYLHGRMAGLFARMPAPPSIDGLIAQLGDLNIDMPGSDILTSDAYDGLTEPVTDAKIIGPAIVGGEECLQLAFRNEQVDWAIWISTGEHPLPCRYVVTSKHLGQAPQYTIQFSDWQTDVDIPAGTFAFDGAGSTEVDLAGLAGLDELPSNAEGDLQ